jgi:hypothetical protein
MLGDDHLEAPFGVTPLTVAAALGDEDEAVAAKDLLDLWAFHPANAFASHAAISLTIASGSSSMASG